ncbi:MAG: hypothetical protein WC047_02480 [Kiritimatiellales bacterium]
MRNFFWISVLGEFDVIFNKEVVKFFQKITENTGMVPFEFLCRIKTTLDSLPDHLHLPVDDLIGSENKTSLLKGKDRSFPRV